MTQAWHDGNRYEDYMGRWSRLVAVEFLRWLAPPMGVRWLDVGCGTGALTQTILNNYRPLEVLGVDRSDGFVAWASEHIHDARARFRQGDAAALPVENGRHEMIVSGLMLNFVTEPAAALAEMRRAIAPAGRVGVFVWDYTAGMKWLRIFWDAAIAVNQDARAMDQAERYTICNPVALRTLFGEAGLNNVRVDAIEVAAHFRDFDDYWEPLSAGGPFPAPTYLASRSEDERDAIRAEVRGRLPIQADGSFVLGMRAWAVQGKNDFLT